MEDYSSDKYRPIDDVENKRMLLEMMDYVHNFCVEHDIQYFLYFGSMLGAVRHKGYIPWDDDIDICMTRKEYEKFIKVFPKDDTNRYKVMTPGDVNHYVPYGKIIDNSTVLVELKGKPIGLFIDIFIIDNEGHDLAQAKRFLHFVSAFVWIKEMVMDNPYGRNTFRRTMYYIIHYICKIVFREKNIIRRIDRASKLHCDDELWEYVGSVNASHYNERQILRGEWFKKAILTEFEDRKYYIPEEYDNILKVIYVNYMDLPSKESQVPTCSFKRWKKLDWC